MDKTYLKVAAKLALKSNCLRAKTGAVLVKDGRVLVGSHNRIFPENDFCRLKGCLRDKLKLGLGKEAEKCRSIHAEAAGVALAAQKGISLKGGAAYITCQPCLNCAKLLFAAGIRAVYFLDRHADETGKIFLEKMGVVCRQTILENDEVENRLRDITLQKK